MSAASDARYERDHGSAVPAIEARQRADRRLASDDKDGGRYWIGYAREVESWTEAESPS
jgi:hypothetical protein